jgi:hypothetical protein
MEKQFSSFSAVVKEAPHQHSGGCGCCPNTGCPKFGG